MRISGGKLKGRRIAREALFSKKGVPELRPTSSKVREALFDILRSDLEGASFLDLYAGTGTVGFEALSRGAAETVFVEHDKTLAKAISDCIGKIGLTGNTQVFREEAGRFLRRASLSGMDFGIIFADPPYASGEILKVLPLISETAVLKPGGCLVIEHPSRTVLPDGPPALRRLKSYKYGDTMLTLYRREK